MKGNAIAAATFCTALALFLVHPVDAAIGSFEGDLDIGAAGRPGQVQFDKGTATYSVSGSGANMWFTNDALHYVWKRVSGDLSLAADIRWPDAGGNAHRKACLIIRQSLDPDSAYADAALHGNGLTSLQYRESAGDMTREIQSNVTSPARLRIEKHGDYVAMSLAAANQPLRPAGGAFRIQFKEPFYVGIGVCSHDNSKAEKAVFSNVVITIGQPGTAKPVLESTLETISIASKDRRVVYHTPNHIEAPNWSADGKFFLFNGGGHLWKLPVAGGVPEQIDSGWAVQCNNDHGFSPNGSQLAISDQTRKGGSRVYLLPFAGGIPRLVTLLAPSYWHGWSPDGKQLVFCGQRNMEFDIFSVPVEGGPEKQLTDSPGLDDGPEFSGDGQHIYFNSVRTGRMQIWRMKADGSDQTQITSDQHNNWFPHPSPDGKWLAFLSYAGDVEGHPENKDVTLRIMALDGGEIQVLAKLFGGQGTINVPSWSPDSRNVAFMSYQFVEP